MGNATIVTLTDGPVELGRSMQPLADEFSREGLDLPEAPQAATADREAREGEKYNLDLDAVEAFIAEPAEA